MKNLILKTIFASYLLSTTAYGMDHHLDALGAGAPSSSPVVAAGHIEEGNIQSQILAIATETHALIPYATRLQASFTQLTPAAELLLPEILGSLASIKEASVRNAAFKDQMDEAQADSDRTNAQIEETTAQAMRDAEQASNQSQRDIAADAKKTLQGIVDADAQAQREIAAGAEKAEAAIQENADLTARQIEEESARTQQQIAERHATTAREIEASAAATSSRIEAETATMQREFNDLQRDLQSMSYQANGFISQGAFDARLKEMMDEARADQNANRDRLLAAEEVKKQGLLRDQEVATTELLAAENASKQTLLADAEIKKARLLAEAEAAKVQSLEAAALKTQELKATQEATRIAALDAEKVQTAKIIAQLQISLQAQREAAEAAFKVRLADLGSDAQRAVQEMTMLTQLLSSQISSLEEANVVVAPQGSSSLVDAVKAERQAENAKLVEARRAFQAAREAEALETKRLADEARAVAATVTSGTMASAYAAAASVQSTAASSLDTTVSLGEDERKARALAAQELAAQKEAEITAQKALRIAELAAATASTSSTVLAVSGAFDMSEWAVQTAAIAKLHPTIQEKLNAVLSDIGISGVYGTLNRVKQMGFRAEFSTLIADPSDAKIASYRAKHFKK